MSANKIYEEIDHHRRLFLRTAAMAIAAAQWADYFDKQAIANTKRLVNAEFKALMERGFHKRGDIENRLGYYLGQLAS
jgi:hypothetical protein